MSSGSGSTKVADKTPPRWLLPLFRQFGKPEGRLGRLALRMMERGNQEVNAWALELLAVGPSDRFLDVGCGPGVAVQLALGRDASAAGVDVSELAVAAARRRNPAARVEVAAADALPFDAGAFTTVLSVNSMGFWPDPEAGVREIRRVLAPGGRLAIALRMKVEGVRSTDRRAYGSTPDQIVKVENLLRHVGFGAVVTHEAEPGGELTTVVTATGSGGS